MLALRVARWYQVQGVRHPAAALRRGRVDDAIDDVQGIRLAVGRQEFLWGSDIRTVGRVDLVKAPVPGDRVDRVRARRHLFHRRHRGLAAEAERVVQRIGGWSERALVPLLPEQFTAGDVDAEQIVGDAGDDRDLPRALGRSHTLGDQRREEVVHLARLAIELDLPQQFHVLDVGEGEDFLVLHPAGTAGIVAFGQVVGRHERRERRRRHTSSKTHGRLSEVLPGYLYDAHRYELASSPLRRWICGITKNRAADRRGAAHLIRGAGGPGFQAPLERGRSLLVGEFYDEPDRGMAQRRGMVRRVAGPTSRRGWPPPQRPWKCRSIRDPGRAYRPSAPHIPTAASFSLSQAVPGQNLTPNDILIVRGVV